jgi:hypothetical protein
MGFETIIITTTTTTILELHTAPTHNGPNTVRIFCMDFMPKVELLFLLPCYIGASFTVYTATQKPTK